MRQMVEISLEARELLMFLVEAGDTEISHRDSRYPSVAELVRRRYAFRTTGNFHKATDGGKARLQFDAA